MNDKKNTQWNKSYQRKDNFIFYPHEDVIRFISKYIKKRIGIDSFSDKNNFSETPKVLDFGCGIGRHILLLNDFKLDGYGFDLSDEAIKTAKDNFKVLGLDELSNKVITASITDLPYNDNSFDFMLSHGVLDSMSFDIAQKGIAELHRTLKKGGLIYFDVIDTEDASFNKSLGFDQLVESKHEEGTIQSYYNEDRINELIDGKFDIVENYTIKKTNCLNPESVVSRFHVIIKKK